MTYDRLRAAGGTVTVVNRSVTERVADFDAPEGQAAQQGMADEIVCTF